jgi:hypothetical protein
VTTQISTAPQLSSTFITRRRWWGALLVCLGCGVENFSSYAIHALRGAKRVVPTTERAITSRTRLGGSANGLLTALSTLDVNINTAWTCLIADWRNQPRRGNESQMSRPTSSIKPRERQRENATCKTLINKSQLEIINEMRDLTKVFKICSFVNLWLSDLKFQKFFMQRFYIAGRKNRLKLQLSHLNFIFFWANWTWLLRTDFNKFSAAKQWVLIKSFPEVSVGFFAKNYVSLWYDACFLVTLKKQWFFIKAKN